MWILDTNALIICMKDENKNIFKNTIHLQQFLV